MTNRKTTGALFSSVIALVLCCAMLVGSTFAWFTDSASTAVNKIVSGNLKIGLQMKEGDNWVDANEKTLSFTNNYWEPGCTYVLPELRVVNNGNLALKYEIIISGAKGDVKLLEAIEFRVNGKVVAMGDVIATGNLNKQNDAHTLTISAHMKEEAGNEYQNLTLEGIGITVKAYQHTYEHDSIDDQYDAVVYTQEQLAAALQAGIGNANARVILADNIKLTGTWTPVGDKDAGEYFEGTLEGNGYTISGLSVKSGDYVALISAARNATIKDLTVSGAVSGKNAAGIVARVEGNTVIENCVSNVTVSGSTKAGGIACNVTNADALIVKCTNYGAVSGGDSGIGGIVGYVNNDANLQVIKCANIGDVTSNNNKYAGAAVGYAAAPSTGVVVGFTNSGKVTGTVLNDGRYLKEGETVLCGYVGTIGNWSMGVSTVAEANALLENGTPVTMTGCNEPDGILYVPDGGKLTLVDSTVKSVQGEGDLSLVVLGDVVVNANGSGAATVAETETTFDGSAVTAKGKLTISGTGNLTAKAADVAGAFGIGGKETTAVTIQNITIDYVSGSFVQPEFVNDTSHGKTEPEGGAAIGSGYSGAVISLEGVTIKEAHGGSKAAGIGARYWTGVSISIKNSVIEKVVGGNASAGIGGSRVPSDANLMQDISITIVDSSITAFGGQFAAGIGSGYDTHCAKDLTTLPKCEIYISGNSVINATGGKYGAGIGTGYHTAGLSGVIEESVVVNAVSGGSREKYTAAMPVGFGVVDMTREGSKAAGSYIEYKGAKIALEDAPAVVNGNEKFAEALNDAEDGATLYLAEGTYTMPSTSKDVTITGTKDTVVELPFNAVSGNGNVITFEGVTIEGDMVEGNFYSELFNGATKVVYKNCEIKGQISTYCDTEFVDCVFTNSFEDDYSVFCYYGSEIKFDGCTFNTPCSKAIKVYDEGNCDRDVYVNDCTFNTKTDDKAAVEIDSTYNKGYNVYFTGTNTINGAYTKLWNDKASNSKVYIDDVLQ